MKTRVKNHIHIRHIMLYHYEKGLKAAQSFRDLQLFGEKTIRQCRESKGMGAASSSTILSLREAPTDYHVSRSLKNWQTNKIYMDLDDLVADVKAWIASKSRDFFARGIDLLPSKWEAVTEVDGDYAPK